MSKELSRFLQTLFDERKAKNPRYSLRAFARQLEVDSSTLSSILTGRRKVSPRQVTRILRKLGIEDVDVQLRFIASAAGIELPEPPHEYSEVDMKVFAAMRDWEHSAIMAAFDIDPTLDEARLARLLGLPASRVHRSVNRLRELGMVVRKGNEWRTTSPHQVASPSVSSRAMRDCHRQYIEKALDSLEKDEVDVRDISGITVSFERKRLPAIRLAIREFRRKIADLADRGGADSVYRLNVQLFPLTKGKIK